MIATLATAAIVVIALAAILGLAARAPSWYRPSATTPERALLAEAVEQHVLSEISAARAFDTPWTLTVTSEAATAWLNDRLPAWAANQDIAIPSEASLPVARFDAGEAAIAFTMHGAFGSRIITLAVSVTSERPQTLRTRLGSLPLPAFIVGRAAPRLADQMRKLPPPRSEPWHTIRLDDGRSVSLTGITAKDGALTLHAVTRGKSR